ncbi:hypothetical protein QVD17_22985 [Tagetes erecta]|uniref:Phytocyanin domain-containing protein n=1 Tax=Tagetes erecta TaxID=13708 RepID=A0AAD8NLZ5_TARER|nr:hypothetical protein QVD17_22985 [Tagetes erecta]
MANIKMINLVMVMTMVVASMEFHGTMARELFVGDSFGWNVPNNQFFFDIWVINQGVKYVNDVLVFNFTTGVHNVAEVSLQAHDACDGSNPIQMYTSGPARVSLNTAGIHCFISTIGSDCKSFMNMIVRVEHRANNSSSMLSH